LNCVDPIASFTDVSTELVVDFTNASTSAITTYAWDFDDGNTSTDENPSNTYTTAGTYNVCLTITDSCGTDTFCEDVVVSTIGIDENNLVNGLSLYPVPTQNVMTIENLTSGENFKLELLNNLGQVVKVVQTGGLATVQMNLSDVINGYYNLRVSNSNVIGTRPVVIKH
jgi:PKD repeat protein